VIGQAKTGTGKTLAFGIPILQRVSGIRSDAAVHEVAAVELQAEDAIAESTRIESGSAAPKAGRGRGRGRGRGSSGPTTGLPPAHGAPQALIVVPTRELAVQVASDLLAAGKVRAVRVHALYGGRAYEPQVAALRAGIDVAVGTPGRLLDLAQQKHLDLSQVRTLVLDEADEMLDLGFLPDVERIIDQLPAQRQTMLFSATMPGQVISLARRYMTKPTHIRAADPDDHGTQVRNISQFVYRAHSLDKIELLSRVLQADGRGLAMVFARTKRTVAKVADELAARHFAVAAVHGDLGQGAREQALRAFRNGKVDVLVATDVAARGIDVEGVTHVVNFQCPEDEKVYTHRIGRTGRAGAKGIAVTLVDWDEVPKWQLINKSLDLAFPDPPEVYSTSPQLFSDLGIAPGSKGVLPRLERTREGLDAETLEDVGETGRGRSTPKAAVGRGGAAKSGPKAGAPSGPQSGSQSESQSGSKSGAQSSVADEPRTERQPRTPRQRTRSRGGVTLDAGSAGTAPVTPSASSAPPAQVAPSVPVASSVPVVQPEPIKSDVFQPAFSAAEPSRSRPARSRTVRPKPAKSDPNEFGAIRLERGSLATPDPVDLDDVIETVEPIAQVAQVVQSAPVVLTEQAEPTAARKRTRSRKKPDAALVTSEPGGTVIVDATIPAQPTTARAAAAKATAKPVVIDPVVVNTAAIDANEPAAPKKTARRRPAKKTIAADAAATRVSAEVLGTEAVGAEHGQPEAGQPGAVANPRRTKI
jgi:superfamily II DNA/RNA helicase